MIRALINAGAQTAAFARHGERDFIEQFVAAIGRSVES
jgi:hypothetical protein